jgi:hypothetical protein
MILNQWPLLSSTSAGEFAFWVSVLHCMDCMDPCCHQVRAHHVLIRFPYSSALPSEVLEDVELKKTKRPRSAKVIRASRLYDSVTHCESGFPINAPFVPFSLEGGCIGHQSNQKAPRLGWPERRLIRCHIRFTRRSSQH